MYRAFYMRPTKLADMFARSGRGVKSMDDRCLAGDHRAEMTDGRWPKRSPNIERSCARIPTTPVRESLRRAQAMLPAPEPPAERLGLPVQKMRRSKCHLLDDNHPAAIELTRGKCKHIHLLDDMDLEQQEGVMPNCHLIDDIGPTYRRVSGGLW